MDATGMTTVTSVDFWRNRSCGSWTFETMIHTWMQTIRISLYSLLGNTLAYGTHIHHLLAAREISPSCIFCPFNSSCFQFKKKINKSSGKWTWGVLKDNVCKLLMNSPPLFTPSIPKRFLANVPHRLWLVGFLIENNSF